MDDHELPDNSTTGYSSDACIKHEVGELQLLTLNYINLQELEFKDTSVLSRSTSETQVGNTSQKYETSNSKTGSECLKVCIDVAILSNLIMIIILKFS